MARTTPQKQLLEAARAAGLRITRTGGVGPRGKKTNWQVTLNPAGWLTVQRPAPSAERREPVILHADWIGPVKFATGEAGLVQRIEIFVGTSRSEQFDRELHPGGDEQFEHLLAGVLRCAGPLFDQDRAAWAEWQPPPTRRLAAWLAEAGQPVAMDSEGNLRMTIRASGRDGQVRVLSGPGQLRLVMPLGTWPSLRPRSRAAMLQLAGEANGHLRLARTVWRTTTGGGQTCQAQVDLTGLGSGDDSDAPESLLLGDMTHVAVAALALALKRLAHELEILADPGHKDLAELILTSPR